MCEAKKKVYKVSGRFDVYDGPDLEQGEGWSIEFISFNAVVDYAKEHKMEAVLVTYTPPDPLYLEI